MTVSPYQNVSPDVKMRTPEQTVDAKTEIETAVDAPELPDPTSEVDMGRQIGHVPDRIGSLAQRRWTDDTSW